MLNFRKHSNQVELDQFYSHLNEKNRSRQHITKSAFFQARKQISHTAFIDLNQRIISNIYKNKNNYKTWKGFRLCAVDGTTIRLPSTPDVIQHFGMQKYKNNQGDCSIGMASVFYDVLNNIVIDSSLNPHKTSERECVINHLVQAGKNDLVLYDRGYVAFWLYALHIKHNHHFCMRAKTNQSLIVKDFIKSKKKDALVTFYPNKSSIETCKKKGLSTKPLTLRLVRVELPNEVEVLITNLTDDSKYKVNVFKSLYHMRWGIEENYKRLKQWVEIENFSGKSALSVQQDFYSKIVSTNLTALMVMGSQKIVSKKTKNGKLKYHVNFAQALSKMKHHVVYLIRYAHKSIVGTIKKIVFYISQTIEAVRDGRTAPRKVKHTNNNLYFSAYKSSL